LLDNFNRANSGTLGASWAQPWGTITVASNAAKSTVSATYASAFWSGTTYTDVEVYYTLNTLGTNEEDRLFFRMNNTADDATTDGYALSCSTIANTLQVTKYVDGSESNIGASISQTISNGDSLGISMVGSTITVWYKTSAGSWTSLGTRTDASYSSGYIGFNTYFSGGTLPVLDDFGGGTYAPLSSAFGDAAAHLYFRNVTLKNFTVK
jgi:hypothetical protein